MSADRRSSAAQTAGEATRLVVEGIERRGPAFVAATANLGCRVLAQRCDQVWSQPFEPTTGERPQEQQLCGGERREPGYSGARSQQLTSFDDEPRAARDGLDLRWCIRQVERRKAVASRTSFHDTSTQPANSVGYPVPFGVWNRKRPPGLSIRAISAN